MPHIRADLSSHPTLSGMDLPRRIHSYHRSDGCPHKLCIQHQKHEGYAMIYIDTDNPQS